MRPSDRLAPRSSRTRRAPRLGGYVTAAGALTLAGASSLAARRLLAPAPRETVPEPVIAEAYFSAAEIRAGREFARPQRWLSTTSNLLEFAALVRLTQRQRSRRLAADRGSGSPAHPGPSRATSPGRDAVAAGLYGAALTVGTTGFALPFDALARHRSLAVGLSTQDWPGWAADLAKATALEAVLTGVLHTGSSALATRYRRRWWLPAAGGAVGVAILAGLLAPVLTDPIFNTFEPLAEGQTRSDVLDLAAEAGVNVGQVYSVDASRRTTAVNAYVNGLGPTKRVVLFDTLLDGHGAEQVRFVVAHELGHVRHRDVWRLIGFLALSAPAGALAVQELTRCWAEDLSGPGAVPALYVALSLALIPVALSGAALSRAIERRTDDFGLTLSHSPEGLISFFRQVAVANHADVTPGGLLHRLGATHPPITERIGAALAFQRAQAA